MTEGRYAPIDLSALNVGSSAKTLDLQVLEPHGVKRFVNFGNLENLVVTAAQAEAANAPSDEAALERLFTRPKSDLKVAQKRGHASRTLRDALEAHGIELAWLSDLSREMELDLHLSKGVLGQDELSWSQAEIDEAVTRARVGAAKTPLAGVWIDYARRGGHHLEVYSAIAVPRHPRGRGLAPVAVLVTAHPEHCPLDPPILTPQMVKSASDNHLAGIIIEARRSVVFDRAETLRVANDLRLPIHVVD